MVEDNSMVLEQQQQMCLAPVIVDEDPQSIKVYSSKVEDLFWDDLEAFCVSLDAKLLPPKEQLSGKQYKNEGMIEDVETIACHESDFVATSCQERIKIERKFEEFSSSLEVSQKFEFCVDGVCINENYFVVIEQHIFLESDSFVASNFLI